ncbi:hypothetical protein AGMMS4957_09520 [Bacteroidia bacterium]|nr:hypothetical protein AGMMS4957_09520 [Bacteroidia bacterium]
MIILLLVVAGGVFGVFYYNNIYIPAKIDREAPRYYTFANATNFRSSKVVGATYNKIGSIPYGSELITYEHDADWSFVKFNAEKGYVASDYLLDKKDFFILNSIFGDVDSRECVSLARCRRALLDYFKKQGFVGAMSSDLLTELLPNFVLGRDNQWQVFSRAAAAKQNTVFYAKVYDKSSKFTDFAVIIKNTATEERRILIFGFKDDETPFLFYENYAPSTGYIKNITNRYGMVDITYSD